MIAIHKNNKLVYKYKKIEKVNVYKKFKYNKQYYSAKWAIHLKKKKLYHIIF